MKNKKISLFITLLLTFIIGMSGVNAAVSTSKKATNSFFNEINPLKLPYYTNESIEVTAPSGATVQNWRNDADRPYKVVVIPTSVVNASGTVIKVKYPKVGTYNDKEIGVNATYTVYKYRDGAIAGKIGDDYANAHTGIVVAIPYDFTATGTGFFNSEYEKISYDFFYTSNNASVDIKNALFTFNSLNYYAVGEESVMFDSSMANNISNVYTYENGNIKSNINVLTASGTSTNGVAYSLAFSPTSNENFCDAQPSSECYLYNSATIKYNGKLTYTLGSISSSTGIANSSIWFSPSTTINEKPTEPTKYINKSSVRVNDAEYSAGSEVIFEIDQKVNTLGKDLMTRYTSFSIVDTLPKEVDYEDAKIYDKDGKELSSSDGKFSYDKTSNKVTWTAENTFLSSMPLKGETYTIKIKTKLNSNMKSIAKNSAYSIFNSGNQLKSNEVVVRQVYKLIVHHYLEGTTTKLAEDEEYSKEYDEKYTTSKSSKISNEYELVKTPSNAEGTIKGDTEVTYYYKKKESIVVNVPKTSAQTPLIILGVGLIAVAAAVGIYVYKGKKNN